MSSETKTNETKMDEKKSDEKKTHIQEQLEIMQKDIKDHGMKNKGVYNRIKWAMKRPCNSYWCGYVYYEGTLSNDQLEKLDELSHGGLTSGLGFDCAHWGDFAPFPDVPQGFLFGSHKLVFRTHDYVYDILKEMIDYITSTI